MSADKKAEGIPFFLRENASLGERCDLIWVTALASGMVCSCCALERWAHLQSS